MTHYFNVTDRRIGIEVFSFRIFGKFRRVSGRNWTRSVDFS